MSSSFSKLSIPVAFPDLFVYFPLDTNALWLLRVRFADISFFLFDFSKPFASSPPFDYILSLITPF
jgi:hypothetical protein